MSRILSWKSRLNPPAISDKEAVKNIGDTKATKMLLKLPGQYRSLNSHLT